jgi:hypothetical protein
MRLLGWVLFGYQLLLKDGVQSFSPTTAHHGTRHHRWSITKCQPNGVVGLWFEICNHHNNDNHDNKNGRRLGTKRISLFRVDDTANYALLQWPTISHRQCRKGHCTPRFAAVVDDEEEKVDDLFFRDNYDKDDVALELQQEEEEEEDIGETMSSKNDIQKEEEEEEILLGDMDMTLPTNEDLATLTPGTSDGFFIVKHYNTSLSGDSFDWNMIQALTSSSSLLLNDKDIERLALTPHNMSLPVALMLLDPKEYPSQSKARKACRKASILIHRGPLLRNPESLSRLEPGVAAEDEDEDAETWFDPQKCIRGHVGDRIYPGGKVDIYYQSLRFFCFVVVVLTSCEGELCTLLRGTGLDRCVNPITLILSSESSPVIFPFE